MTGLKYYFPTRITTDHLGGKEPETHATGSAMVFRGMYLLLSLPAIVGTSADVGRPIVWSIAGSDSGGGAGVQVRRTHSSPTLLTARIKELAAP